MLGTDARVARAAWTVLLIAGSLILLWLLRDLLFLLTVALFFSYMLSPVVGLVERYLPKNLPMGSFAKEMPLVVVYLAMLGAIAGAGFWIGANALEQATRLSAKLPELLANRESLMRYPLPEWAEPARAAILEYARGLLEGGFEKLWPHLQDLSRRLLSGLGSAALFLLVPIFAFYFLKDGIAISNAIINRFPADQRSTVGGIFGDLHRLLSQYIRSLALISVATFVAYEGFFLIVGGPYSTLLATLAAVLEVIPVVGPLTAAITALAVAGFSGYSGLAGMVIFFVAYRLFTDYVLQPFLMSSGVAVHPLAVLAGLLAGEQLAGIPGLVLSIPLIAAFRVIYLRLENPHFGK